MACRPSESDAMAHVFCGTVVHATDSCALEVVENAALGVKGGKVVFLDNKDRLDQLLQKHQLDRQCVIQLKPKQFVMPGMVDCHIHSPQLSIQALGTDLGLLDWLNKYTFPAEARYKDREFARQAHRAMVNRTLRGGTTSASYFSSIHTDTSLFLFQAAEELGQRALVGKCNMDQNSPDFYVEKTADSIADTKRFVSEILSHKSKLVTPVITPRFAIACTGPLMKELAQIAKTNDLPIQTHMSETRQEIDTTLELFPGYQTYAELYDDMGLLGPKTILAHCIHVTDKELTLLKERGCGVVHCACSNNTLRSGVMDIRRQLDRGIKMGLGTDMGAGYTTSMLAVMRDSVDASNVRAIQHENPRDFWEDDCNRSGGRGGRRRSDSPSGHGGRRRGGSPTEVEEYKPLTMSEAFRLATLGGSTVLGQNCGNFELGREFDALLVDPEVEDTPLDLFPFDSAKDIVLKFLYYGDDRNIVKVYVLGREVVDKTVGK